MAYTIKYQVGVRINVFSWLPAYLCVFLHSLLYSNKTQSEKRKDVENRKEIVSV